ncbi:MAG TPA: hypothetical protein VN457_00245, partial [Chlamydiales bacterium]|nr:hypothetical protein [Chlamydiales bacterium]
MPTTQLNPQSIEETNAAIDQFLKPTNQKKKSGEKEYLVISGSGAQQHLECRSLNRFERWGAVLGTIPFFAALHIGNASMGNI